MAHEMEELWRHPEPQTTTFYRFKKHISEAYNVKFGCESSENSLFQWSIANLESFWGEVWKFTGIRASSPFDRVSILLLLDDIQMEYMLKYKVFDVNIPIFPRPAFFAGAKLNFAENLLFPPVELDEGSIAVISVNESNETRFTWKN
jgi:acetoacetyl-CoA synthetase